jgi:putative membrane protein
MPSGSSWDGTPTTASPPTESRPVPDPSHILTAMGFVIKTLGAAASLWVAVWIVEGFEFSGEWWQFLIVAVIMGVVNAVVKPVLKLFSLPLILLTLGLFLLVVNAIALAVVVWLSGVFELGLTSDGFFWETFLAAIVVSVVSWILGAVLRED